MKEVMKRFSQLLWEREANKQNAEKLYQKLVPGEVPGTLYWPDIDYSDQKTSFWAAVDHYTHIQTVLTGFGPERLLEDKVYAGKMTGALKYWLINDFENPNWWHNQIGTPQNIGNITIMMYPVLDKETVSLAAKLVSKGSMEVNKSISPQWTGANLTWGVLNTIRHALLTDNEELLAMAAERGAKEITIGLAEGIQKDYSFFQHGPRLYSGGYGRSFINDISHMLFLLNGTKFQFPKDKTDIIISYILQGLQPLIQGDAIDWASVGREISRKYVLKIGTLKSTLEIVMRTQGLPRKEELKAFLDILQGKAQPDMTKYYDRSCMLCHHYNGIYVGAKFINDKTWGAEICNGEGMLCYNMSYGTHTCIMRNGREYCNINPVWDYSRIPGTTSRPGTDSQLLAYKDWVNKPLPNGHSGGVQKGRKGVIYELCQHQDLEILVSDFAFEDGFVALGTGLECKDHNNEGVVTTVDQCLLQGPVTKEKDSVIHNGIRYTPLQGTYMETKVAKQEGSWRRNNIALSDEKIEADVVTLTIPYNTNNINSYAYMISAASKPLPQVEVLRNDKEVQAIRLSGGEVMAVFHESSVLTTDRQKITGNAGTIIC